MKRFVLSRTTGTAVLTSLALLSAVGPLAAQNLAKGSWQRIDEGDRGWIGVSFSFSGGRDGIDAIVITEVSRGSPAAEVGLRAGDRVMAVNQLDTPRELAALPELLQLRTGDPVVMVVERDDERRRFTMTAAPRPAGFAVGRSVEITMRSDSLVDTWSRSMDSLRIHLRSGEGPQDVTIREIRDPRDGVQRLVVAGESDRRVRAPFEFFVFHGEAHDSLRQEMVQLNTVVVDLQERIRSRELELRQRVGSRASAGNDPQLRRLADQLDRVSARSGELEAAMAEAARETAGLQYEIPRANERRAPEGTRADEFRPLTPYLLGRNLVAGAEVIDLEPELARYFEVAGGVLVTKVASGTPAAIAGLVPGDVIIRMDQVGVGSVEDLRYGVSVAGDVLPLTLIREGESRQVLLRKR